jgi:hypothetical protein
LAFPENTVEPVFPGAQDVSNGQHLFRPDSIDIDLFRFEVAETFEVPFDFLMDPARHERHSCRYQGSLRSYVAVPYQGRFIWGATAAILVNLHSVLSR